MKLSVMMITYNHERFIAQALASVLAQRVNFDYEVVVGEDCSTDGTRDILMDFYRRYPDRIVPLMRNGNLGMMRNLEATLAACRGRYVALLEGDDYWTCEDKLQRQVDFLDAHADYAICCHRVQVMDEMGTRQVSVYPSHAAGPYAIEALLKENFIQTCTAVCRRVPVCPFPSWFLEMNLGDWPLFALMASFGKIELMDETMAVYRVHSGGIWTFQPPMTQLREVARMLRALDAHLRFQYTNTIRRTIARYYLRMAMIARLDGNRTETGRYLVGSLRNGGLWLRDSQRTLAALAAYTLFGSWYEALMKARRANRL